MPHLDSTGPEGKGPATGRGLGPCKGKKKSKWPLGIGMGKRRKSDDGGEGMGKRFRSGDIFDKEE